MNICAAQICIYFHWKIFFTYLCREMGLILYICARVVLHKLIKIDTLIFFYFITLFFYQNVQHALHFKLHKSIKFIYHLLNYLWYIKWCFLMFLCKTTLVFKAPYNFIWLMLHKSIRSSCQKLAFNFIIFVQLNYRNCAELISKSIKRYNNSI